MYILFYNSNVYYNIVVILVAQFAYKLPCQIKKLVPQINQAIYRVYVALLPSPSLFKNILKAI